MTLIDPTRLQQILERGLLHGYWSVAQFNAAATSIHIRATIKHTYPSVEFLHANPQFRDYEYRDWPAFAKASQHNRERGII